MRGTKRVLLLTCLISGTIIMGCAGSDKMRILKPLRSDIPLKKVFIKVDSCQPQSIIVNGRADAETQLDIRLFEILLNDVLKKQLTIKGFSITEVQQDAELVVSAKLISYHPTYWVSKSYVHKKEGEVISTSYAGRGEWTVEVEYIDKFGIIIGLIQAKPKTAINLSSSNATRDLGNQIADYSANIRN